MGVSNFTIPELKKLAKSGIAVPAMNKVYPPSNLP